MLVQSVVLIDCYITAAYCDIFAVLVPPLMIFMDVTMIKWGRKLQQWYYMVYLLVSLLSMFVAVGTMFTIIWTGFLFPGTFPITPSTIAEQIMRLLSYGVIVISFIQIMMLIYLTSPQKLKVVEDDKEGWLHHTNQ